jgi:hypothetical protein
MTLVVSTLATVIVVWMALGVVAVTLFNVVKSTVRAHGERASQPADPSPAPHVPRPERSLPGATRSRHAA